MAPFLQRRGCLRYDFRLLGAKKQLLFSLNEEKTKYFNLLRKKLPCFNYKLSTFT